MSSYLVLARKYRPRTFEEVVGQESVTRVLCGAIDEGRVGHAYLFAGPRGTGKTTVARILAKCLNCETGPTTTPCGTCERCMAADAGSEVDIVELDAASHTGVDTIRELRDEVAYAPMRARRKVYIIDEVHMLSKAAFNALLKTLEEPPPHVVFLFATTEPHKVLDTILSRCQVLRLTSLDEEQIIARLAEVFRLESVQAEDGITAELARAARGGMRDALSLADKLLALAGDSPTLEDLKRLGGSGGAQETARLVDAIAAGDRARVLTLLAENQGDETQLAAGVLDALRTCLVLSHCGVEAPFIGASDTERAEAFARAKTIGTARLELWMQALLRARERMRLLPDQSMLVLEVALLDLCRDDATLPLAELVQRLEALEGGLPAPTAAPAPAVQSAPATRPAATAVPIQPAPTRPTAAPQPAASRPEPAATAPPAARAAAPGSSGASRLESLPNQWAPFIEELGKTHGALASVLEQRGGPRRLRRTAAAAVTLHLADVTDKERRVVNDRRNAAACTRAMSTVIGEPVTLALQDAGAQAPAGSEGAARAQESIDVVAAERPVRRSKDDFTEKVADLFGGVVEEM